MMLPLSTHDMCYMILLMSKILHFKICLIMLSLSFSRRKIMLSLSSLVGSLKFWSFRLLGLEPLE